MKKNVKKVVCIKEKREKEGGGRGERGEREGRGREGVLTITKNAYNRNTINTITSWELRLEKIKTKL